MPKIGKAGCSPPTKGTLRKYGMTEDDWATICARQGFRCPVCSEPFGGRKLAIDHEHVAGFRARKRRKSKRGRSGKRSNVRVRVMMPEERKEYVRGILHAWCNRFVRRWLTLPRARTILNYLEDHDRRKQG